MAFKMKGPFFYGSPMKKDYGTLSKEQRDRMKRYNDRGADGQEVPRVASKKVTKVSRVDKPRHSTMSKIPEYVDSNPSSKSKRTRKRFKDTKVGKFLSKKRTNQPRKKYNPRLNRFE